MTKESFVFILGLVVLITPFLGIPVRYKESIIAVCGGLLIVVGYRLRRRAFLASLETDGERRSDAFVESTVANGEHAHMKEERVV